MKGLNSMAKQDNNMTMQEFVDEIEIDNGMTKEEATMAYRAVINGIKKAVANGRRLQLYGFGTFYLQLHKGHKMQFQPTKNQTDDYLVLKFSASSSLNKHIREGRFTRNGNVKDLFSIDADEAETINPADTDVITMIAADTVEGQTDVETTQRETAEYNV